LHYILALSDAESERSKIHLQIDANAALKIHPAARDTSGNQEQSRNLPQRTLEVSGQSSS